MTIGIGRKFGRRIILLTDTMISDAQSVGFDAIPGRLKGIVLSPTVSVAYAGHADPAIYAIRQAKLTLIETSDPQAAAKILQNACLQQDHEVEFIIAFHENGNPHLHKITKRGISLDLDACFVGDAMVANAIIEIEQNTHLRSDIRPEIEQSEYRFVDAFHALFQTQGIAIKKAVGGFPITLLASPFGHTYSNESHSLAWDMIDLSRGITPEQHQAQHSGETAWIYNLVGVGKRGVAIVGAALPQAGLGLIYRPLIDDSPEVIRINIPQSDGFLNYAPLLEAVATRVRELSSADRFGVDELPMTWSDTP